MECKCDLRTRLVGDGCSVCNSDLALDIAADNDPDADVMRDVYMTGSQRAAYDRILKDALKYRMSTES